MSVGDILFWIVGLMTALCAVMVVVTQHIVRCAIWLLFTLAGTAGLFFLLGLDFLGATQLFVYVGGTLVLVIFGVMLTATGPFLQLRAGAGEWAIAIIVGLLLYGLIALSWLFADWSKLPESALPDDPRQMYHTEQLGRALLGDTSVQPASELAGVPGSLGAADKASGKLQEPPKRQASAFLLPFEIVSVHLLVVLIGAAYLARAKRKRVVVAPRESL
ncbi:MAG: NADH-quinone oxidoreductase subunit J [Gemmatales bacterium]|nr:NADH-quinone oxidoreductase subunit J [Gemmatales bacterium]MDW7995144.1 NADH-quinone oxidoreductase subunit J [Gemmatales bacterium]